jgi:predicted RNase H-like HicB family nuclease
MSKYAVVVHEDPEGGFWGEVPALPGCYSQGETIDELKHNIREAIVGVLEVLREQGQEPEAHIQILDVAV